MADNDIADIPISCYTCKVVASIKSEPGNDGTATAPKQLITDLIKVYIHPTYKKYVRASDYQDDLVPGMQVLFLCKQCLGVAEKHNLITKPHHGMLISI